MPNALSSTRARVALLVTVTLVVTLAVVATAGGTVSAIAGPAPGLCKMNVSRGKVPASFPIDGCVSGGGIFVRDTLGIPVGVDVSGDTGRPRTTGAPLDEVAAAVTFATRPQRGLLVPGEIMFIPVGSGAASVTVRNVPSAAAVYVVAAGFGSLIPLHGGGTAVVNLVGELTDVYLKYRNCVASAGTVTKVKCGALLARDVAFAAARAGIVLASRVKQLAVAAITQLKFTATLNGQLNKISSGARTISLAGNSVTYNCEITQPRSIESVTRSEITFANRSEVTIDVYWLNYSGGRVFYYTLASGQSYLQRTWLTHPWVAVDRSGTCHGYTLSDTLSKTYVIP